MATKVFLSYNHCVDHWRAAQLRKLKCISANQPASDEDWYAITRRGDDAIRDWINRSMAGRPVTILLIGSSSRGRKWINYEIEKSYRDRKTIIGVYVHHLLDHDGGRSTKGPNPFEEFRLTNSNMRLSHILKTYDPPTREGDVTLRYIADNLDQWIEEASQARRAIA